MPHAKMNGAPRTSEKVPRRTRRTVSSMDASASAQVALPREVFLSINPSLVRTYTHPAFASTTYHYINTRGRLKCSVGFGESSTTALRVTSL